MNAPLNKVLRHQLRLIAKWEIEAERAEEMEKKLEEQQY